MVGRAHTRLRVVLALAGLGLAIICAGLVVVGAPPASSAPTIGSAPAPGFASVSGSAATPGVDRTDPGRVAHRADARTLDAIAGLSDECGSPNPFLVTSRFVDAVHASNQGERTVLFAFRDTIDDLPSGQVALGTYRQVGTVYGLAVDGSRNQLYAAAYVKRGSLFPPGGPGVISRIDLATGAVTRVATLAAGSASLHRLSRNADADVVPWVGRASLGDIDADASGSQLFAANLFDGLIYRLAIPGGSVVGSFAHGAASLAWGSEARPFGLAIHNDRLYHGVVEPIGASRGVTVPVGHIYRSRADGSDLARLRPSRSIRRARTHRPNRGWRTTNR